ncbi:hypothetical protein CCR85_08210 [Rhodothalassium salexigens]|uniref:phage tail protein n=1 Tax=Rhodothalassium salexigens TaxID=1086 RepID=UPI001911D862|nr:phage tail protein [Rhodothalassium salexigens]MBK5911473.1 hypothetical protein [Rhodothalassium salexigens]
MASLLFAVGGAKVAGPIGALVGSLVGSQIDAALFGPGTQTGEGPRLDDLSVQASTYGRPVPRLYGTNRVAGNVIWSSGLKETATTETRGGKGMGAPKTETTRYTYHVDCAIALGQGPIRAVRRIWADSKLFRAADGTQKQAADLRLYPGSQDQEPDPVLQAALGPDNTPAFRGLAYMVFEGLELADFGNRIPNLSFEVVAGDTHTVATVIEDLLGEVGVPYLDAARTETLDLPGYALARPTAARGALDPLRTAWFFDMAEIEGVLEIFPADATPAAKIPRDHLAAHPAGTDRPQVVEAKRTADLELPRQVSVQYLDPARDYQINTQRARRSTLNSTADVTLDLPVAIPADTAKTIAERMLGAAWQRRDRVTLHLPLRYLPVTEPGMKLVVEVAPGQSRTMRVTRKEVRLPGSIRVECEADGAGLPVRAARAAPAPVPEQAVLLPGPTVAHLLDLPLLRDGDGASGVYVAANGALPGWRGAGLLRSRDGRDDETVLSIPTGAVIGTTVDALTPGPADYWDRRATVTVSLLDPAQRLASVAEAEVLDGVNAAVIGDEIVQFTTATLVAPAQYRLSGLLRGRKGTEAAIAGHGAGERFVLLTGGGIERMALEVSEFGLPRTYKAAALGTRVSDATAIAFTWTGRSGRPLAPVHLRGRRDGDDLVLSWIRRTRLEAPWLDGVDVPLGEETQAYDVDILDARGAVVRTLSTSQPTVTYTGADQVADFGAVPAILTVRVYQLSARFGRGLPTEGAV